MSDRLSEMDSDRESFSCRHIVWIWRSIALSGGISTARCDMLFCRGLFPSGKAPKRKPAFIFVVCVPYLTRLIFKSETQILFLFHGASAPTRHLCEKDGLASIGGSCLTRSMQVGPIRGVRLRTRFDPLGF